MIFVKGILCPGERVLINEMNYNRHCTVNTPNHQDTHGNWVAPPNGVDLSDENPYLASKYVVVREIPTEYKIDVHRNGVFIDPPESCSAVSNTVRIIILSNLISCPSGQLSANTYVRASGCEWGAQNS